MTLRTTSSGDRALSKSFEITDEFTVQNFRPGPRAGADDIDTSSIDLTKNVHRTDKVCRHLGAQLWQRTRVLFLPRPSRRGLEPARHQKMWLEAVKWAMGITQGDAAPRPQ